MQHEGIVPPRGERQGAGIAGAWPEAPDPPAVPSLAASRLLRFGLLVVGALALLVALWGRFAVVPAVWRVPAMVTSPLTVPVRVPMDGRIAEIGVAEGDRVPEGALLLVVVNDEERMRLAALEDRLAALGHEKAWLAGVLAGLDEGASFPELAALSDGTSGTTSGDMSRGRGPGHGAGTAAESVAGCARESPPSAVGRDDGPAGTESGCPAGFPAGREPGRNSRDGQGNVSVIAGPALPPRSPPRPVASRGSATDAPAYWRRVLLEMRDEEAASHAALAGFDRRLQALDRQLAAARRERDLLDRQVAQIAPLAAKGRIPRNTLDGLLRAEARAEGAIAALNLRREEIVAARRETGLKLHGLRFALARRLHERILQITHETRALDAEAARLRVRSRMGRITAPQAGRVRLPAGLDVGMSLVGGAVVMEIVPEPGDRQLLVEAAAKDIAELSEGARLLLVPPHSGAGDGGARHGENGMQVVVRQILTRRGPDGRVRHVLRLTLEGDPATAPFLPGTPLMLQTPAGGRRGLELLLGPVREIMARRAGATGAAAGREGG